MSYGNSKKWIAPGVREKQKHDKLNTARNKICRDSPFWHHNFDIDLHRREFNALLKARLASINTSSHPQCSPSNHPDQHQPASALDPTPPWRTTVSNTTGKSYEGYEDPAALNRSAVLMLPTVFTPYYKSGEEHVAPWPSKSEMKYEGDDRIATDKLHGRFPGAPRVEGNETVNWQHRNVIVQYDLENFHIIPCEAEVLARSHFVPETDLLSEEEGSHLLGDDLFEMLDPVDRL